MSIYSPSLVSALLGLAAAMVFLSLLVQIVQELYKFLANSRGRAFTTVLVDMLGPWARQLYRAEALPDLVLRGPFQFWRIHPRGVLLPLECKTLVAAMERTAPSWVQSALRSLRLEIEIQNGTAKQASRGWNDFVAKLRESVDDGQTAGVKKRKGGPDEPAVPRPPGYWTAREVFAFLQKWNAATPLPSKQGSTEEPKTSPDLDARALMLAFRREFLPHVLDAERDYPQLMQNFEYAYRRRNRRHAFTIGLVIALVGNFPFHRLWEEARRPSSAQAVAVAERAVELYETSSTVLETTDDANAAVKRLQEAADELSKIAAGPGATGQPGFSYLTAMRQGLDWRNWQEVAKYAFGCLITAILASFGAPFWNDIAKSVLRIQQGRRPRPRPREDVGDGPD